ncbi:tetratricopeptide repeat protein [Galbibacter mesophilus]|uniref:tetratricopeptide repeat protein n=1 Tax=Galbibacter mesophilus TaxID=379069 RepID=UPI00191E9EDC|nr:tetratricopeptide repeat protein [Galbibacter mesophilus]MCM5662087.1 tetratricopeptide repeat protein [Galbibacter mesophilus]
MKTNQNSKKGFKESNLVFLTILGLFLGINAQAQDSEALERAKEKALSVSKEYTFQGNEILQENNDVVEAEAAYRKAIAKSGENAKAKYNLGNVYYNENSMGEAFMRFKEAGNTAKTKEEKHKAYHNLGNVFMKNKEYQKAVEAYKEALRNNPKDEETRYNLALAKEMLKKQQEENQNNQDQNQDQDKDNQDENKDNQDQQDKKEGDEGEEKDDDQGDQKDDKGENNDEEGENPEDNKQDEGKENPEDQQKQNQGDKPQDQQQQQQQPRPNQLSPQQIKNILEAMNNEEKKVQDKINAEKVKGVPVKSEKDW